LTGLSPVGSLLKSTQRLLRGEDAPDPPAATAGSREQFTITRHGVLVAWLVPVKPATSPQLRETIAKLKEFSKGQTLSGLKIKDLISKGLR
jgi:hypothetical protein